MMLQTMLVGMDWGESTESLAALAPELAILLNASVKAVYVEDVELIRATRVPPVPILPPMGAIPYDAISVRELEARFRDEEARLGRIFLKLVSDTRVRGAFLIERGEVAPILIREARAHDLLMIGKYSEKHLGEPAPLGAHVEQILRRAWCPVLLVPPEGRMGPKMLVAYDGSAVAHRALGATLRLSKMSGAEITVLSVANETSAKRILLEAEAYLDAHRAHARMLRREGDPAERILEEMRAGDYDLLAMGAFGQGRLRELLGATVTRDILRRVDRSVLVTGPMEDG